MSIIKLLCFLNAFVIVQSISTKYWELAYWSWSTTGSMIEELFTQDGVLGGSLPWWPLWVKKRGWNMYFAMNLNYSSALSIRILVYLQRSTFNGYTKLMVKKNLATKKNLGWINLFGGSGKFSVAKNIMCKKFFLCQYFLFVNFWVQMWSRCIPQMLHMWYRCAPDVLQMHFRWSISNK